MCRVRYVVRDVTQNLPSSQILAMEAQNALDQAENLDIVTGFLLVLGSYRPTAFIPIITGTAAAAAHAQAKYLKVRYNCH